MKVIKPVDKNDKEFHQVIPTQVFEFDGKAFMKVEQFKTDYNAVNLTNGKFVYITAGIIVRVHPHAELHLK